LQREIAARYLAQTNAAGGVAGGRPSTGLTTQLTGHLASTVIENKRPEKASKVYDAVMYNLAAIGIAQSMNANVAGGVTLGAQPAEFIVQEYQLALNFLVDHRQQVASGQELVLEFRQGEEDLADLCRLLLNTNRTVWQCNANAPGPNPMELINNMPILSPFGVLAVAPGVAVDDYMNDSYTMSGRPARAGAGGYGVPPGAAGAFAWPAAPGPAVPAFTEVDLVRAMTVIVRAVHDKEGFDSAVMIRAGLMSTIPASQAVANIGGGRYTNGCHKRNAFVTGNYINRPRGSLLRSLLQSIRASSVLDDEWETMISDTVHMFVNVNYSVVATAIVNRSFAQARREMGVTPNVLCPNSAATQVVGANPPGIGARHKVYDDIVSAEADRGLQSTLMQAYKVAAYMLFNVDTPHEVLYLSCGDTDAAAVDKMPQAQMFQGRVPCGMSLFFFPIGIVSDECAELAGVYISAAHHIKTMHKEYDLVANGAQVRTAGPSSSTTPTSGTSEAPTMRGGPGMLGHGLAILRVPGVGAANASVGSTSVVGATPNAMENLAAMVNMFSARTVVNVNAAMAAANVPYLCADELFADIDLPRAYDLQFVLNNPTAALFTAALSGGFNTNGPRIARVAMTKMIMAMQVNSGISKRRKLTMPRPGGSESDAP